MSIKILFRWWVSQETTETYKMQKPLVHLDGKQGSLKTILQQSATRKQLVKQIRCHSLTDCLNILENSGYTGDTAILLLANLQSLEVEA